MPDVIRALNADVSNLGTTLIGGHFVHNDKWNQWLYLVSNLGTTLIGGHMSAVNCRAATPSFPTLEQP